MQLPSDVILILIAIFGGVARYLDATLNGKEQINWVRFLSYVLITGFTGYMAAQVMLLMYPSWVFISAGVGGYAGTQIMDFFVEAIKLKLGASAKDGK